MYVPKQIEALNRVLGERLGRVLGGSQPRFMWMHSAECFYFLRAPTAIKYTRYCWAERVGKVWMLCQWRPPSMSEADWAHSFGGEFPYPRAGQYYAHPETALPPGMEPDGEITARYIASLDRQMSLDLAQHARQIDGEIAESKRQDDERWDDTTEELAPAFGNWNYGTRSGNVSFGGM